MARKLECMCSFRDNKFGSMKSIIILQDTQNVLRSKLPLCSSRPLRKSELSTKFGGTKTTVKRILYSELCANSIFISFLVILYKNKTTSILNIVGVWLGIQLILILNNAQMKPLKHFSL